MRPRGAAGRVVLDDLEAVTAPLVLARAELTVATAGPGFTELTADIADWIAGRGLACGALLVFCRHTSASLTIQENADPDVRADLTTALERLAPQDGGWTHTAEGPDDMPAHVKAMLTAASLTVPVADGRLGLGTWQGIYLIEHRHAPHRRKVTMQFQGTAGADQKR